MTQTKAEEFVTIDFMHSTVLALGVSIFLGLVGFAVGGLYGFIGGIAFFWLCYSLVLLRADAWILKKLGARQIGPCEYRNLFGRVLILSKRLGMNPPDVYILPVSGMNAICVGRTLHDGAIAVTEGLVAGLHSDELHAILTHQLIRIKSGRARHETLVAWVAWCFLRLVPTRARILGPIFYIFFAPLAAILIQLVKRGNHDLLADQEGASLSKESHHLTSCLLKCEKSLKEHPLYVPEAFYHLFTIAPVPPEKSALRLFISHPPLEHRLEMLSRLDLSSFSNR